ncbi:MAG: sporulation protein YabP [Clostridiales bacterium]|nr:sporulation protein YabP [Clostridiales bacterium]
MEKKNESSNIIIENREKMSVSGVLDVVSFDDAVVVLDTELGSIVVRGQEFRINKLNVDIGELVIEGKVDGFSYEDFEKNKPGFFARMFK